MRHSFRLRERSNRLMARLGRDRRGPGRSCGVIRPAVEALEGRALLALTPLDPTFGTGGVVAVPQVDLSTVSAVGVQPDGKVVVVQEAFIVDIGQTVTVRRFNVDGTSDPTFGVLADGSFEVGLPTPAGFRGGAADGFAAPNKVIVQPDGKIVVAAVYGAASAGSGVPGADPNPGALETQVVRLNAYGSLDTTFGRGGTAVINSEKAALGNVALQADGKIVLAGSAIPTGLTTPVAAVARLNADGTPDATFDNGGILTPGTPTSPSLRSVAALAIDPNGKIVLAGSAFVILFKPMTHAVVIRLNADGTPDTSLSGTGFDVTASVQTVAALAVQPDSKILVAGNSFGLTSNAPVLARLNADGSADAGFNAAFTIPSGPMTYKNALVVASVAVQPDGKVLVGGSQPTGSTAQSLAVARFNADGSKDAGFGVGGESTFRVPAPAKYPGEPNQAFTATTATLTGLAIAPDGKIVVAGGIDTASVNPASFIAQPVVARLLPIAVTAPTPGDYTGDGKADPAIFLPENAIYAYRKSDGTGDVVQQFGIAGAGGSIPAPGDYEGTGITDAAVYLPSIGAFAIRPSGGGPGRIIPFGPAGAGQSIPAPGDYDGDGKTDLAVYLPASGVFAYRPSSGGPDVLRQFGIAGVGGSIPAPGDYDNSGRTELAVYLPSLGAFAFRSAITGTDSIIPFGIAGAGRSIPVPGDYNGDGITDLAVYLPGPGVLAYRPSNTANPVDVLRSFGTAGAGGSIPAPGDYDGDGKADAAVYLPAFGAFAYRPSSGGPDVVRQFGIAGAGRSIPASLVGYPAPVKVSASSAVPSGPGSARLLVPLTEELMTPPGAAKAKRRVAGAHA